MPHSDLMAVSFVLAACALPALEWAARGGRAVERGLSLATSFLFVLALLGGGAWWVEGREATTLVLGDGLVPDRTFWLPSLRVDGMSFVMAALIASLGFVVARYSARYLAGDPAKRGFQRSLSGVLGSIAVFGFAGDLLTMLLAWVAMGSFLDRLLLHRAERARAWEAVRARRRSAVVTAVAMVTAILSAGLVHGTVEFEAMALRAAGDPLGNGILAAWIAIAGLSMCVQPPFHSWLVESIDTNPIQIVEEVASLVRPRAIAKSIA